MIQFRFFQTFQRHRRRNANYNQIRLAESPVRLTNRIGPMSPTLSQAFSIQFTY